METTNCQCGENHEYDACECDCEACDRANGQERNSRVHFSYYGTTASMMEGVA